MKLNASARIMPDWSRKLLYLHKNSEKQNSDANLQSQFSHVFPPVWGRHVHDSWDNPSSENETKADPRSVLRVAHFVIHLNKASASRRGAPDSRITVRLHRHSGTWSQPSLSCFFSFLSPSPSACLCWPPSVSVPSGDFLYCNSVADRCSSKSSSCTPIN